MQDMLVRLLDLPDTSLEEKTLANDNGIIFRKPIAPEKSIVVQWVKDNFSQNWADETEVAFSHTPTNCIVSQRNQSILGFACFECTAKNFFGPTGVLEKERGKGIGKILLIKALLSLKEMGYTYAVIGGVGPFAYYQNVVDARIIEKSDKSVYQNLLKHNK